MRIGIIGAMDEEVELLREKIADRNETSVAGCDFYCGTIGGLDVVLLKSGIGKTNAAMATAILNERFKPDYVINTGSAGGFHQKLDVGDVVISEEVRHHDVDATIFGYEYGQVPQMPAGYKPDPYLVDVAEKAAAKLEGAAVERGLIATGDSFMNDADRVEFVRKKFPDLYAAEMEAASIAQVCHQFGIPFVIIRSLSDIAGKESNISFEQFLEKAALHSANLILDMLDIIGDKNR
ncbi:5'-methylthioadenosine/S-adenosylhomocysteine nucleosidase [Bacillus marinisedimentorum]|uniref:5'-methylthioadenosine/S-adenosylhomocysteine nucleosidase n=1 Tax=Bacillus marinisedimentorum TaxID=1821260 RepID=UPI00087201F1|nr:5'-methylthioadenosine/S-adenosylhomocysteine nucleosidase [Bacillus marinisedimentorum]